MKKTQGTAESQALLDLLKAARAEAGLSQVELATALNVTQSFVSKCERGERRLDVVELRAWCKALGISFLAFLAQFDELVGKVDASPNAASASPAAGPQAVQDRADKGG